MRLSQFAKRWASTLALLAIASVSLGSAIYAPAPASSPPSGAAGGDLSGSYPNPGVGKINGTTVTTAGGALTTGAVLRATSAAAVDYGAVDLANAAARTGVLPAANQAAQTMAGDVTGTTAASVLSAISGSSPIAITPNTLRWVTGATPLFTQVNTSGAGADMTLAPQLSTTGTPGSVNVNVAVPQGAGLLAGLKVQQNGTTGIFMGNYTGGYWQIKFGAGARNTGGFTDFAFLEDDANTTTQLNGNTAIKFRINASSPDPMQFNADGVTVWGPSGSYTNNGGGSGVISISAATTVPTSNPTSAVIAYANPGSPGSLGLLSSGISFNRLAAATLITQDAKTTDVATTDLTITPQAPWSSATGTNRNASNLVLTVPPATSGGASGAVKIGDPISGNAGKPVQLAANAAVLSTAANITLSSGQIEKGLIQLNGTTQVGETVTVPNTLGGSWCFDFTGVTIGANTVTITTGAGTSVALGASSFIGALKSICCHVYASNFVSCGGG